MCRTIKVHPGNCFTKILSFINDDEGVVADMHVIGEDKKEFTLEWNSKFLKAREYV